jgi:AraC family transcriptional regulator
MPEPCDPGNVLRAGQFYSPIHARLHTEGVLLSELRQPSSRVVPRHEHELPYVTLVLRGDYLEGDRDRFDEFHPFTAVFNPAGARHTTVIGPKGAVFFSIEFRPEVLRALDLRLPDRTVFDRGAGSMLWPGLQLYSAFRKQAADPLILESHVAEILGTIAALGRFEKRSCEEADMQDANLQQADMEQTFSPRLAAGPSVPRWFVRVRDRLHDEFRSRLRMCDLARDAGVHPVHLARVFRRFEGRTPGDYQQRLQVRAACELLRDPEWTLAAIAVECGFADQSHFTRVFRRMTGATPARLRRSLI